MQTASKNQSLTQKIKGKCYSSRLPLKIPTGFGKIFTSDLQKSPCDRCQTHITIYVNHFVQRKIFYAKKPAFSFRRTWALWVLFHTSWSRQPFDIFLINKCDLPRSNDQNQNAFKRIMSWISICCTKLCAQQCSPPSSPSSALSATTLEGKEETSFFFDESKMSDETADFNILEQVKYICGWILVVLAVIGVPINLLPLWLIFRRDKSKRSFPLHTTETVATHRRFAADSDERWVWLFLAVGRFYPWVSPSCKPK